MVLVADVAPSNRMNRGFCQLPLHLPAHTNLSGGSQDEKSKYPPSSIIDVGEAMIKAVSTRRT
jgi:hypothetical protein